MSEKFIPNHWTGVLIEDVSSVLTVVTVVLVLVAGPAPMLDEVTLGFLNRTEESFQKNVFNQWFHFLQ